MRATFVKPNHLIEREDWLKIDGTLCKEYKLRPWELDELTIPECIWLLLALKQEQEKPTLSKGQDPVTQQIIKDQMDREVQKKLAYQRLSAKEKLDLAMRHYPA